MDNDFDSVSWQRETEGETSSSRPTDGQTSHGRVGLPKRRSSSNTQQAGRNADAVDLAGIADGSLDVTVDTPLKENDGTKDAYVSYLVTTHVCPLPDIV
jgi:sorting nexin-4